MTKTNTINYGGIKLEKLNQTGINLPTSSMAIKLPTSDRKALAIAIKNNIPCLLIGETGTGKTSAVKELAFKLKQNYTRISLTGYTTPDELIGSKSVKNGATYYENGILTRAMIEGHICVLDELNAITPDCSFIIHSLLDDERKISLPNGDIITPHKDFRIFGTINPDYEGTKSLNRAFLDRFGVLVYFDILSPAIEEKLLIDRTGIKKDIAKRLIATAWLNRKAYSEGKTMTLISTRSLLQVCELLNEGLKPIEAYKIAVVNKARLDEKRAFLDFFNINFRTDEGLDNYLPEVLTPEEVRRRKENLDRAIKEIDDLQDAVFKLESNNTKMLMKLQENKIDFKPDSIENEEE